MSVIYPPSISMALLPTPVMEMKRLTEYYGGPRIFFKRDDLTGFELSGNKIRKLEFLIADAKSKGATVLITCGGLQSNHCRAVAAAGARLGIKVHLLLRGRKPEHPYDGNLLLDKVFGAEIDFCTEKEYRENLGSLVAAIEKRYKGKDEVPYYFPVGASIPVGCWGYVRAFEEVWNQMRGIKFGAIHLVNAVGSGGTTAGLVLGRELMKKSEVKICGINVCDSAEYFQKRIRQLIQETKVAYELNVRNADDIEFEIIDGYVGEGYAIPYAEEMEEIKRVAELEGVLLDPVYTGKAFYGLVDQIQKGSFDRKDSIVFFHTGGALGIFAQKEYYDPPAKK